MGMLFKSIVLVVALGLLTPVWAMAQDTPIGDSLASPARPTVDRVRDATRKPAELLKFATVTPGMQVFEYAPGGGWYSEVLSHYLGDKGHLVAFNDSAFSAFYKDEADNRFGDNRLANVTYLEGKTDELILDNGTFDAALFILAYHDLYFRPDGARALPDRSRLLKEIHKALKPSGFLIIVDHAARPGTDPQDTGATLHRIDPLAVQREAEAAGFILASEASFLANPDDPKDRPFWELEKGTTDRFVYRFTVR